MLWDIRDNANHPVRLSPIFGCELFCLFVKPPHISKSYLKVHFKSAGIVENKTKQCKNFNNRLFDYFWVSSHFPGSSNFRCQEGNSWNRLENGVRNRLKKRIKKETTITKIKKIQTRHKWRETSRMGNIKIHMFFWILCRARGIDNSNGMFSFFFSFFLQISCYFPTCLNILTLAGGGNRKNRKVWSVTWPLCAMWNGDTRHVLPLIPAVVV